MMVIWKPQSVLIGELAVKQFCRMATFFADAVFENMRDRWKRKLNSIKGSQKEFGVAMLLADSKKREEAIFGIFQEVYCLSGEFIHDDSPDFVGSYKSSTLGVEITEIYSGETLREREVQKERIVARACEKAIKAGLPPLNVHVLFTHDIQQGREIDLINLLFELVKNNCPQYGGHIDLDWGNGIPDDFYAILIRSIPGSKNHFWDTNEAGCVDTNFSAALQQRINAKAEKIGTYLTKCDKCWLIIAALGVSASNFYQIGDEMKYSWYESPFEKVFFMEAFSKSVKELNVNVRHARTNSTKIDKLNWPSNDK